MAQRKKKKGGGHTSKHNRATISYQGTQSSVESITIEIQDTPAVYFTFKYTWITIYRTEGNRKILCKDLCALFATSKLIFNKACFPPRLKWLFKIKDAVFADKKIKVETCTQAGSTAYDLENRLVRCQI
ncbi:hypothetical protein FQA47_002622 [Oryzias melastigma]|uniref:Uncharacterized protein n=1 Tax=Oryzias melastigma TaxID=30732 RepID=A0A834FJA6_ORYME|nr:hypothetical protein FQA47_002622 [Oryzias melastigma]